MSSFSIPVTQEFVDYADNEFGKGSYRTRLNCDALLLEWYLIKKGVVEPPENWCHDFILKGRKIDVKEISGTYFNIHSEWKLNQYKESISIGDLTHFMFYKSNRSREELLKAGDEVEMEFIGNAEEASKVLNRINKSNYNNGYYVNI